MIACSVFVQFAFIDLMAALNPSLPPLLSACFSVSTFHLLHLNLIYNPNQTDSLLVVLFKALTCAC